MTLELAKVQVSAAIIVPPPSNFGLVEDDQGDVVMITEAFEQLGAPVRLHVAGDGDQAMQFLRRVGRFADAPGPA